MKAIQRENIYTCGNYMQVQVFPVRQTKKYQRRSKYKPTTEMQVKLNERYRADKLWMLVNLNFSINDLAVCPTYADEEMRNFCEENTARAMRDWNNFRRRLIRLYASKGIELKYVMQLQFSNGTGYHFHFFLSGGVSYEEIKECWGLGRCHIDPLEFDENGVEGYIRYIQRGNVYTKKWCASKNLRRPEPKQTDERIGKNEMFLFQIEDKEAINALYPGYVCTTVNWEYNELYGGEYARARFYKIGAPFYYDQYKKVKKSQDFPRGRARVPLDKIT